MAKPNALRQLAIQHFKNGKSVKDIIEILAGEVSRSSVYYWIGQFKKFSLNSHSKPTGRGITITTRKNKEKVKRLLSPNSERFVSRYCKISQSSVVRICKELNLKPYKYRKIPFLNKSHIVGRKKFAVCWRKNHSELFGNAPFMFSDEKIFTVHGGMNSQNKRIYAYSREQAIRKGGINDLNPLDYYFWNAVISDIFIFTLHDLYSMLQKFRN